MVENRERDEQTKQLDQVYDAIFDHGGPRVKHCTTIFRDAIEEASQTVELPKILMSRNIRDGPHQVTSRNWKDNNGLHFSFRLDEVREESISEKAVDYLSDEEETLV